MGPSAVFLPLAIRVLLSTVFLVAGLSKLVDLGGSVQALREFGVPRVLSRLGVALPPVELAVAIGLLFTPTALYAAWGALALLLVFIAGIAVNLIRGRRPDCHCFGQVHSRPISRWTLGRNIVLAGGAAWLLVVLRERPATGLWTYVAGLHGTERRMAIIVAGAILFAILSALRRDQPDEEAAWEPGWWGADDEAPAPPPRPRPKPAPKAAPAPASAPVPATGDVPPSTASTGLGLPVGTPAPAFALPDPEGRTHSLDDLRAGGKPVLLVFSSPHCGVCRKLGSKLPALAARHAARVTTAVITREGAQAHITPTEHGPLLLIQRDGEVTEAYDCTTIPSAVVVGLDGVIRTPAAIGGPEIESLFASVDDASFR